MDCRQSLVVNSKTITLSMTTYFSTNCYNLSLSNIYYNNLLLQLLFQCNFSAPSIIRFGIQWNQRVSVSTATTHSKFHRTQDTLYTCSERLSVHYLIEPTSSITSLFICLFYFGPIIFTYVLLLSLVYLNFFPLNFFNHTFLGFSKFLPYSIGKKIQTNYFVCQ